VAFVAGAALGVISLVSSFWIPTAGDDGVGVSRSAAAGTARDGRLAVEGCDGQIGLLFLSATGPAEAGPDATYYTHQALGYAALPPALVMLAVSIMNGPVSRRVEPARAGGRDW
jgi:hypothetical protein